VDESPILFSGTNRFGNTILGSSVDEDYSKGIERYFHAIVEGADYFHFLKRKVTYLELLRKAKPLFVLDKMVADNKYDIYGLTLADIPQGYVPAADTLCPETIYAPSFQYTAALQGGLADTHRALPKEVSQTQNQIAEAITSAFNTVRSLFKVEERVFLEASYKPGSFEITYGVEIENLPVLFQKEQGYYTYLNDFFEYCFEGLPAEAEQLAALKFDEVEGFKNLIRRLSELSIGNEIDIAQMDLRESVARDLTKSAHALESASKDIGKHYKAIAVSNGSKGCWGWRAWW
jgi:hypothetical protein